MEDKKNIIMDENINNEKKDENEDDYSGSGFKSVVLRGESSLDNKNFEKNLDLELKSLFPEKEEETNYYIKNKYILNFGSQLNACKTIQKLSPYII